MQNLGISIKDLKKVPAVSQGTQAGETHHGDNVIEIELDQEEGNLQPFVNIPDDEQDMVVKHLLATQNIDISKAQPMSKNIVTVIGGIPQSKIVSETGQNIAFMMQNAPATSSVTHHNVAITMQNIPVTSGVTPHNVAITTQNVPGTSGFTPQNVSSIGGVTGQNIT